MSPARHRGGFLAATILAVALALGALAITALAPSDAADGPAELAWDRVACAHCQMHVGEPAFAAQARDPDGRVLAFDDPGCLFAYEDAHATTLSGRYFHAVEGDGWISAADVAFVPREPTPMAYGFGAAPAGTSGGLDLAATRRALVARGLLRPPPAGAGPAAQASRDPHGHDPHGHDPHAHEAPRGTR